MREAIRKGLIHGFILGTYAVLGYLVAREIMRGSL
jgi:hypothetical protein